MKDERPFLANYLLALMAVMSLHMFINSVSALLYPDVFSSSTTQSDVYLIIFTGVAVGEMILTVFLFMGSGIAYKFTVLTLIVMVTLTTTNMVAGGILAYDIWMQSVLGAVCLVFSQLPTVKGYYDNWSFGRLMTSEA